MTRSTSIHSTIQATLAAHAMLSGIRRLLLAVSGGRDSVAMLHGLRPLLAGRVHLMVGHVHHGLRGEAADQDQAFVKRLADRLRLPFVAIRLNLDPSPHRRSFERPARKARYRAFRQWADAHDLDAIATGHTLDDQLETFFLRLLRGCSLTGLRGIPYTRPLAPDHACLLIRPLLDVTRQAITDWLARQGLPFREDRSNQDLRIPRNTIRHTLIPPIMQCATTNVYTTVRRLQQEAAQLKADARKAMQAVWEEKSATTTPSGRPCLVIPTQGVRTLSSQAAHELLTALFGHFQVAPEKLSGQHSKDFQAFLTGHRDAIHLPDGLQAWRTNRALHFFLSGPAEKPPPMNLPFGQTIRFGQWALRCETVQAPVRPSKNIQADETAPPRREEIIDTGDLDRPLIIRTRLPGDRFHPLGARGHQKLKEFLRASRIPPCYRDTWPIVCAGDKIVWIPGLRIADPVRLTAGTASAASLHIDQFPESAALCLAQPG